MTVLAWHDICYRKNIRLRFPSSLGFIQWKNLWHKDKGPKLNAKSSLGRSCISFPSRGAASLVRVGTGNSPRVSLKGLQAQWRHGADAAFCTAANWADSQHQTSGKPLVSSTARGERGIQQGRVWAPLSTFWIWLVNAPRCGEEQGKIRFLTQSGYAAWFCQDSCVCFQSKEGAVCCFVVCLPTVPEWSQLCPRCR